MTTKWKLGALYIQPTGSRKPLAWALCGGNVCAHAACACVCVCVRVRVRVYVCVYTHPHIHPVTLSVSGA